MMQDRRARAAEWRERQRLDRAERLKQERVAAQLRPGDTQSVDGRVRMPGEHYGSAPVNTFENVFGVEESQELLRSGRVEP